MCYVGNHGTCFPLHTEDMDLGAVNYLHWGKAKIWIVVGDSEGKKLERKIKEDLVKNSQVETNCDNIIRHKDFIVTRKFLSDNDIKYTVLYQNAKEFVVTFPRGFHQGFNLGLNFAEATNFANEQWLEFARKGKQCTCKRKSTTFSLKPFDNLKPTPSQE